MKRTMSSLVIAVAVALIVLPGMGCQKTADSAKETAAEMTESAGNATQAAAESVDGVAKVHDRIAVRP